MGPSLFMGRGKPQWLLLLLAGAFGVPASAQHSNGYVFVAPGGATCCGRTTATIHAGVGGEAVLTKGIGVGAEIGPLAELQIFDSSVIGLFSINGYYHFNRDSDSKWDPFVTGGYSNAFRSGHISLGNFGVGTNYWFVRHFGLRAEFRDHVHHGDGATLQYWGFRFGLAFH